jgi:hypothetical protein
VAAQTPAVETESRAAPLRLGGYAALAESEWMGAAQASEVLEPVHLAALRDTRTPLVTNSVQLTGRGVFMALFVGSLGVVAVPIAFAVMATAETVVLGTVLLIKLQRRVGAAAGRSHAA